IITFAVHNDERGEKHYVRDSKRHVASSITRSEQPTQSRHPQWKRSWVHENNLLQDELAGAQSDVLVAVRDVGQELVCGPMMSHLPYKVRQCDSEGDNAAEPDPFRREMPSLWSEQ